MLQGFPGRAVIAERSLGSRWNAPAPQQNSVPLHNPVVATSVYKCWRNSFNTDSHKRSGLSSPLFASSIILLAILSLIRFALVANLKSCASHFECYAHDPIGLGIEFGTIQKMRDGHDLSPRSAMELYAESACQSDDGLRRYWRPAKNQNERALGRMSGMSSP